MPRGAAVIVAITAFGSTIAYAAWSQFTPQGMSPQSPSRTVFEGVWREDQVLVTRRDGSVITVRPAASIYVATGTHYSMMATFGLPPRPLFKTLVPTKAEKIAAYDTFWGHSGSYRLAGDTLTLLPIVARMPNLMAGGYQRLLTRAVGDTLWLIGRFSNYYFRVGTELVPDTLGPFVAEEIRLVRIP